MYELREHEWVQLISSDSITSNPVTRSQPAARRASLLGLAFPISAMTCDVGDHGDRRALRAHPSPHTSIRILKGLSGLIPRSSQLGFSDHQINGSPDLKGGIPLGSSQIG